MADTLVESQQIILEKSVLLELRILSNLLYLGHLFNGNVRIVHQSVWSMRNTMATAKIPMYGFVPVRVNKNKEECPEVNHDKVEYE